ncbi:MAG: DUF86 domain-containing protein [Acidobacteriota bacterium]
MKDPAFYLIHIRDCCEKIIEYSAASDGEWITNKMATDAICRNLEIIGEAANKLGEDFRAAHPGIPWRGMIDARNILIHAYDQVNPLLLEDMIVNDIPDLLKRVRLMVDMPG